MKHVLVTHEKGGAGVTTTATNLGYLLAQRGLKVLLVDLDSRGDCATAFGLDPRPALAAYLADRCVGRARGNDVVQFAREGLDVTPTNASGLRSALTLIDGFDDGTVRMWLRELGEGYDFVLYDAKAASGALRRAVLGLAEVMIVATRLEAWGLAEVVPLIEQYRGQGGDPARVVVLPVAVQRFVVHEYNLNLLKERLGEQVWTPVPHRVAVAESQSLQSPVCEYAPENDAARVYAEAAARVVEMLRAEGEEVGRGEAIR